MGWKVTRASPAPRVVDVPLGVAWDADGRGPLIPHHDLVMPDGTALTHIGPTPLTGFHDSASYVSSKYLLVAAMISPEYPALGHFLKVLLLYRHKDPSWREIRAVKDLFFGPDRAALMLIPAEKHYGHGFPGLSE
jgi:hypothetical protein